MSEYRNKLVDLHLLKSQKLNSPVARFQGKGDNRVEKPKYEISEKSPLSLLKAPTVGLCQRGESKQNPTLVKGGEGGFGRVYINKTQYFEGISREVWSYQIGGYQVCDKWLKDRKERVLSLDEIQTYCRIVTSIRKTIEIQKIIDEEYGQIERDIIKQETF